MVELQTLINYIHHAEFGNGIDGDVTISVDTTLASNKNYDNLTINNGITLYPNGYEIRVAGKLTIIGTGKISAKPTKATNGTTAGAAKSADSGLYTAVSPFISAPAGGQGTNAGGGNAATNGSGGNGGTPLLPQIYSPLLLQAGCGGGSGGSHGQVINGLTGLASLAGASGGRGNNGSGSTVNWCQGGNGGKGGGVILLYAHEIDNAGSIDASGGDGGDGGTASGTRGGGGGGGGGGVIVLFYRHTSGSGVGTLNVAGGLVGTGGSGGANGSAGTVFSKQI